MHHNRIDGEKKLNTSLYFLQLSHVRLIPASGRHGLGSGSRSSLGDGQTDADDADANIH